MSLVAEKLSIRRTIFFSDFDALSPHDIRGNCKIAFDAGETLGIHKIIEPADMDLLMVPDKLSVVTYLHQLRAFFTGRLTFVCTVRYFFL